MNWHEVNRRNNRAWNGELVARWLWQPRDALDKVFSNRKIPGSKVSTLLHLPGWRWWWAHCWLAVGLAVGTEVVVEQHLVEGWPFAALLLPLLCPKQPPGCWHSWGGQRLAGWERQRGALGRPLRRFGRGKQVQRTLVRWSAVVMHPDGGFIVNMMCFPKVLTVGAWILTWLPAARALARAFAWGRPSWSRETLGELPRTVPCGAATTWVR